MRFVSHLMDELCMNVENGHDFITFYVVIQVNQVSAIIPSIYHFVLLA